MAMGKRETEVKGRFLRSDRLRAMLWIASNGRCAICGEELDEDWQADHIKPWKLTHRTNVHEMQAVHPSCNRKKGAGA